MATKAKEASQTPTDDKDGANAAAVTEPKKQGLVGHILGFANPLAILKLPMKQKLIAVGVLVLLIAGGGAGVYFLSGSGAKTAAGDTVKTQGANIPAAQATFFDIPDIIVNIQTADSMPAYLKLSVSLELDKADEKAQIEPILPRIVDQFQTYLRELRVEDVRGSAGVMRVKEELLRRVNLAAAPTPVHDVLFKEMIVQ